MSDEADTKQAPVVTVHNHGAPWTVMTSADSRQIDVIIGCPAPIEHGVVCSCSTMPSGEIEFSMLLVGQPQVTYTLSKLQAAIIAGALNEARR